MWSKCGLKCHKSANMWKIVLNVADMKHLFIGPDEIESKMEKSNLDNLDGTHVTSMWRQWLKIMTI